MEKFESASRDAVFSSTTSLLMFEDVRWKDARTSEKPLLMTLGAPMVQLQGIIEKNDMQETCKMVFLIGVAGAK
jgi:hypothetical protein